MTRLHWILHVIGVPLVASIAFGALFGATSWSTRTQLTVIGGSLEVTGFALVALDFWWLAAQRAVGWLARWDISTRLRGPVLKCRELVDR